MRNWLNALPNFLCLWQSQSWNLEAHTSEADFNFLGAHSLVGVEHLLLVDFLTYFSPMKGVIKTCNNQEDELVSFVAVIHYCKLGGLKNTNLLLIALGLEV